MTTRFDPTIAPSFRNLQRPTRPLTSRSKATGCLRPVLDTLSARNASMAGLGICPEARVLLERLLCPIWLYSMQYQQYFSRRYFSSWPSWKHCWTRKQSNSCWHLCYADQLCDFLPALMGGATSTSRSSTNSSRYCIRWWRYASTKWCRSRKLRSLH